MSRVTCPCHPHEHTTRRLSSFSTGAAENNRLRTRSTTTTATAKPTDFHPPAFASTVFNSSMLVILDGRRPKRETCLCVVPNSVLLIDDEPIVLDVERNPTALSLDENAFFRADIFSQNEVENWLDVSGA